MFTAPTPKCPQRNSRQGTVYAGALRHVITRPGLHDDPLTVAARSGTPAAPVGPERSGGRAERVAAGVERRDDAGEGRRAAGHSVECGRSLRRYHRRAGCSWSLPAAERWRRRRSGRKPIFKPAPVELRKAEHTGASQAVPGRRCAVCGHLERSHTTSGWYAGRCAVVGCRCWQFVAPESKP